MLTTLLTHETIQISNEVDSWQEGIYLAANPLLQLQKINQQYINAMIQSVEKYGPYIIITPNVAIAHAKPSEGVNELSMSLLALQKPVLFSPDKPVQLIFVLAAINQTSHLQALSELANLLSELSQIKEIIESHTPEEVVKVIHKLTEEEL